MTQRTTRSRKTRLRLERLERRDVPSFVSAPTYPAGSGSGTEGFQVADLNGDGILDLARALNNNGGITILLGNGDGTFAAPSNYPNNDNPRDLAVADVSGDGIPDLVTPHVYTGIVSVLVGNGDGSFQAPVSYPAGDGSKAVTAGDFDNDGDLDLAVADYNHPSGLSILLNSGGGVFQPPVFYFTDGDQWAVTVGDFNSDGMLDVASTGQILGVHVLLGNGNGTFKPKVSYLVSNPRDIAAADLDGDGDIDLATANGGTSDTVSILRGNGNGTFQQAVSFPGGGSSSLAVADMDADGDIDLSVNNNGFTATILRNQNGSFRRRVTYMTNELPWHVAAGDFNGDGLNDLVVNSPSTITVLLNSGSGFIGAHAIPYQAPTVIAAADFTGDGDIDFAANPFRIVAGTGGAQFKNPVTYSTNLFWGSGAIAGIEPADIDADGDIDAVLRHSNSGPYPLSLWKNNGAGAFSAPSSYGLGTNDSPEFGTVGDVDGDGDLDMVTAVKGKVYVLRNNGNGTLQSPITHASGSESVGVVTAYVNADTLIDIIVTNRLGVGTISVLLGTGGGGFGAPTSFAVGTAPTGVRVADFDGDGDTDVTVANSGSNDISLLLGNGDGTFAPALNSPVGGTSPRTVAIGDFNIDGMLDLVTTNTDSHDLSILFGNGDGTFSPPTTYAVSAAPNDVEVADIDGDGLVDLVVVSGGAAAVDILRGNGDGTFQSPTSLAGPSEGHTLEVGDFNADGMLDIAVAYPSASVGLFRGNGDGSFRSVVPYVGGSSPVDVTGADMDNDGILDLAVTNVLVPSVAVVRGSPSGFDAIQLVNIATPTAAKFGDFNGDGVVDMATTASDGVRVRLNEGGGTFVPFVFYPLTGAGAMVVDDFNGDGMIDLIVAHAPDGDGKTASILLGNGDGTFQPPAGFISISTPNKLLVADFNGDGTMDVAAAIAATTVQVAFGNGDGTFTIAPAITVLGGKDITAGDFNGDGLSDLVTMSNTGAASPDLARVMLGNGDGTFQAPLAYVIGRDPGPLAVGDFDGDGWTDIAAGDGYSTGKIVILRNAADWPPLPIGDGPRPGMPPDVFPTTDKPRPATTPRSIRIDPTVEPANVEATKATGPQHVKRAIAHLAVAVATEGELDLLLSHFHPGGVIP